MDAASAQMWVDAVGLALAQVLLKAWLTSSPQRTLLMKGLVDRVDRERTSTSTSLDLTNCNLPQREAWDTLGDVERIEHDENDVKVLEHDKFQVMSMEETF